MSKMQDELKNDPLMPLRHSTQHIMQAVVKKMLGAKNVMGPAIDNGFYGDFDGKIVDEDLEKIEKEMKKVIEMDLPLEIKKISLKVAQKIFKDNKFKLEILEDIKNRNETVMVCELGKEGDEYFDIDICGGPHVKSTGEIDSDSFKLLSIAGAYWRGDEKNEMLSRIYGTAFNTKKELNEYLEKLEEAKKRDHRKLGKELDLFMMDEEVGQGLILWLPNGAFVRHKIMEFAFNTYLKNGYKPVVTPHIASEGLWNHSGHLDFYSDSMYDSFGIDEEQYRLKPMNCPFHVKTYQLRPRSYKELPMRLTEMGTVYRYEKSGTLHGLTRVRGFTQDDAHIICAPEQLHKEVIKSLEITLYILKTFGFNDFEMSLSVRDPENKSKYIGKDKMWDIAEKTLTDALKEAGHENYIVEEGEAVFYGPKIDIKVADSLGRKWQLTTIQFDFNLPERFGMTYIGEDGKEHTPYMIHRAILGSLERFMGVYIEHTAGVFPVWLAPVQVSIIPIGEKHVEYAKKVEDMMKEKDIRVEVDDKNETMQLKIRHAQNQKVPYMLIIGDKEVENNTVSVRLRTEENKGAIDINKFIDKIKEIELTKEVNLW